MGRVIMNGPPECPERVGWCFVCLMRVKQRQWEISADERTAGYQAGGDKRTIIPWPAGLTAELRIGYYRGVAGEYPMLGVVDGLCWDDLAGVEPTEIPSGLEVPGPLPPALAKRMRGGR